MSLQRRILSTILLLVVPAAVRAQQPAPIDSTRPATLQGTVTDGRTGRPVAGATVSVGERRARTGERGEYTLAGIAPGEVIVEARALGYRATRRASRVPGGALFPLAIVLEPVPLRLDPVRTEARAVERDRFEQTPDIGATVLSREAISAAPVVGEPDVMRTAQLLPGVVARSDYTAGYNVRGGESDQNLVLLDGIPIYHPFHLGGLFGTFIDETVSDIEMLRGGLPSSYGGRLSSVLAVRTADEERRGIHGALGVSALASSAVLAGAPGERTSLSAAGRVTYPAAWGRSVTGETLPYEFADAQLRARRHVGESGTLLFTGYVGRDELFDKFAEVGDSADVGSSDFLLEWGNLAAGITWTQPLGWNPAIPLGSGKFLSLGDSATFTQQLSWTRFDTKLDLGSGARVQENRVDDLRLAGALSWSSLGSARRLGWEVTQHRVWYEQREEDAGIESGALRQRPYAFALSLDNMWRPGAAWLARFGVRAEHVTNAKWSGLSPRLSVKWFATPDLALSLAGGQYSQWMHSLRSEDTPVRVFDYWVGSDEHVPVSRAQDAIAAMERWFGSSRLVRVEAYAKRYRDLADASGTDDPSVRGDEFTGVSGMTYGADLLVRQLETRRLSGWIAYGYAVSARERDGSRYWPAQDRRHTLNAVASLRTDGGWILGSRLGVASGTPHTPVVGQQYRRIYDGSRNEWITTGDLEPVLGDRNSERYPAFHRLDLSVSRRFTRGRATWAPWLSVVNAYDQGNVFLYTYDYTSNPPRRGTIEQFSILPSAGVSVEF